MMQERSRASSRDDYIAIDSSLWDVKRALEKIASFTQCMSKPE